MLRDLPPLPLLQFYATSSYACSYLPQRMARSQVCTPTHLIDAGVYSELVKAGFRRSGVFTYRPWCDACRECQPLRVDVAAFNPNRSQSRAWRRHLALEARERPLLFDEEHYALYLRYQTERHQDGGMDNDSREQYAHFLLQTHVDTRLVEFREAGQLRMVCIIDVLNDGLSSMYTFYDADILAASFGVFAVLWQIDLCRRLDLPWLYLGYWIRGSNKMSYKALYRPAQVLAADGWRTLSPVEKRRR